MSFTVDRLDHLVLTCADIARTQAFYARVLGMTPFRFGEGRHALRFGEQKINLHQQGAEITPNATTAAPGTADLCFITSTPLASVIAHLEAEGVALAYGPLAQEGALGAMDSVYFRDPDGNLIEVAVYR